MIVIDTSAWSRALRRPRSGPPHRAADIIRQLVHDHEPVGIPGIVLQEVLSGVRTTEQFERLEAVLQPFTLLLATREHHLIAARITNNCVANGVAATTPDVLIAATTILAGGTLLTWDADFRRIAKIVPFGVRIESD